MNPTKTGQRVLDVTEKLRRACNRMVFADPVFMVYNPLDYAGLAHAQYVTKYARSKKRVVFLGMNPGPFGMAQNGVPFGEATVVKQWLKIDAPIQPPKRQHKKRPILGYDCTRSEVSGSRLWGLFAERFDTAKAFFAEHYVANYCPLVFLEEGGKNRTPDKLHKDERVRLEKACDAHLASLIEILRPEVVVGVGKFAEDKARACLSGFDGRITRVLHPSPASPIANRGWAPQADVQLKEAQIW